MAGRLEFVFRLQAPGGEPRETTSTPSMWGRADRFRERLKLAEPGMPPAWYGSWFLNACAMQAAHAEGWWPKDLPKGGSMDALAVLDDLLAFIDSFDLLVVDRPADGGGDGPDPSRGGGDGDPSATGAR